MLALYSDMVHRSAGVMVDEMGGLVHEATADANMRLARVFRNVDGAVPAALNESMTSQARRALRAQVMNQIAQQDMRAGWGPNVQAAVAASLAQARQDGNDAELCALLKRANEHVPAYTPLSVAINDAVAARRSLYG